MTSDEMETRIVRLETKVTALTAMVHCLFPATVQQSRHLVSAQFGLWCEAMGEELRRGVGSEAEIGYHVDLIAIYHNGLVESFQKIADFEGVADWPEN